MVVDLKTSALTIQSNIAGGSLVLRDGVTLIPASGLSVALTGYLQCVGSGVCVVTVSGPGAITAAGGFVFDAPTTLTATGTGLISAGGAGVVVNAVSTLAQNGGTFNLGAVTGSALLNLIDTTGSATAVTIQSSSFASTGGLRLMSNGSTFDWALPSSGAGLVMGGALRLTSSQLTATGTSFATTSLTLEGDAYIRVVDASLSSLSVSGQVTSANGENSVEVSGAGTITFGATAVLSGKLILISDSVTAGTETIAPHAVLIHAPK